MLDNKLNNKKKKISILTHSKTGEIFTCPLKKKYENDEKVKEEFRKHLNRYGYDIVEWGGESKEKNMILRTV